MAKKKTSSRVDPKPSRRRKNLLPDEYKREGLITVEMDSIQAALVAPRKLEQLNQERPGVFMQKRSSVIEEKYIVTVHRIAGQWEYTVEHDGETYRLPGAVVDRMTAYRQSIIKEQRSLQAHSRLRKVGDADQSQAAEEEDGEYPSWIKEDQCLWTRLP